MARTGKTRYAILGILSIKPMSGYEIRKFVQVSIGNFWHESYGQIYPVLKELESEGYLQSKTIPHEKGSDKIVYSLTKEGRAELKIWLTKPVESQPYRNELLLKLFFGREISKAENILHLQNEEAKVKESLKNYQTILKLTKKKFSKTPDLPYWICTLDYGIEMMNAELKWIETTKKELEKL
jgi:DNA-binding PadR family transcriptional regulator